LKWLNGVGFKELKQDFESEAGKRRGSRAKEAAVRAKQRSMARRRGKVARLCL
jgi:hypothetical protein